MSGASDGTLDVTNNSDTANDDKATTLIDLRKLLAEVCLSSDNIIAYQLLIIGSRELDMLTITVTVIN